MEGRALPALGCEEVAPFLAGQPAHAHAAHYHRAGTRERLRVDARADHEDRARERDVERGRAEAAVALIGPVGAERQATARRIAQRLHPEQRPTLGADPDPDARPHVADDAGHGALDGFGMLT